MDQKYNTLFNDDPIVLNEYQCSNVDYHNQENQPQQITLISHGKLADISSATDIHAAGSNNGTQINATFEWLGNNFQYRPNSSISRLTIYEMYQKFCQQNNFIPVCKATFGKIIRNQFPRVKSKRFGSRGQSKYHYYNVAFRNKDQNQNENHSILSSFESIYQNDNYFSDSFLTNTNNRPLTILSNRELYNFTYNLNENDHHAIIQSMLSYLRLPMDNQLSNNREFIFINLYKTHCQCLIDAALIGNFAQMRHYILHFWQQLPRNFIIFVDRMNSLDSFMYSLLSNVYLTADSNPENLKRINTIAHLMPQWIFKTFNTLPKDETEWKVEFVDPLFMANYNQPINIGQIKIQEAFKWQFKIKFTIELLATFKKIDHSFFINCLYYLQSSVGQMLNSFSNEDEDFNFNYKKELLINQEQENLIWSLLFEGFQSLIDHLKNIFKNSISWTNQMIVDQIDKMIKTIQDRFLLNTNQSLNVGEICLSFNYLCTQLNRFILMKQTPIYLSDEDDEGDDTLSEDSSFETDEYEYQNKLNAQSYLILMFINDYLILISQTKQSKIDDQ